MRLGDAGDACAGLDRFGMAHDQGHVDQRIADLRHVPPPRRAVAHDVTVVGGEDDDRVIVEPALLEVLDAPAELLVAGAHAGVVEREEDLPLALVEDDLLGVHRDDVLLIEDHLQLLLGDVLREELAHVVVGRVVGRVRVAEDREEEERARLITLIEPAAEGIYAAVITAAILLRQFPAANRRVLAADAPVHVDLEAPIEPDRPRAPGVRHQAAGLVPRIAQHASERWQFLRDVLVVGIAAMGRDVHAGEHRGVAGEAPDARGDVLFAEDALSGDRVPGG